MKIALVIPAYNEEKRIGRTLESYAKTLLTKYPKGMRIIVVSESTDRTNDIVLSYRKKHKQIELLAGPKVKIGKGGAIVKGFRLACKDRADIIGFTDADPSISGDEVMKLIKRLDESYNLDGVIASRYVEGSRITGKQKMSRFLASRLYNAMIRFLFGMGFHDTQCGGKFFKREALCGMIEHLALTDMSFDLDLLYELHKRGFNIVEEPIEYSMVYEGTKLRLKKQVPQMFIVAIGFRLHHSRFNRFVPRRIKGFFYNSIRKW